MSVKLIYVRSSTRDHPPTSNPVRHTVPRTKIPVGCRNSGLTLPPSSSSTLSQSVPPLEPSLSWPGSLALLTSHLVLGDTSLLFLSSSLHPCPPHRFHCSTKSLFSLAHLWVYRNSVLLTPLAHSCPPAQISDLTNPNPSRRLGDPNAFSTDACSPIASCAVSSSGEESCSFLWTQRGQSECAEANRHALGVPGELGQRVELCRTPVPSLLLSHSAPYPPVPCSEKRRCLEGDRWQDFSWKDRNWLREIPVLRVWRMLCRGWSRIGARDWAATLRRKKSIINQAQ